MAKWNEREVGFKMAAIIKVDINNTEAYKYAKIRKYENPRST